MIKKPEKFLRPTDVADRYGVTSRCVRYWVEEGQGPPALRVGKTILFPVDLLEKWEAEQLGRARS
jgi:DNA-binding transcriptional MerR regulator